MFLKAIGLSESGDIPSALIMLNKVVKHEPDHLAAYMELRRIAEITGDKNGYVNHTGAMLEQLIRSKDYDLLLETNAQFKISRLTGILPVRTLFALAVFYEEQGDYQTALEEYGHVTAFYEADSFSLKAYGRMARIYFDRLENREKGVEALRAAFDHPMATDSWRAAMRPELKKYGIEQD